MIRVKSIKFVNDNIFGDLCLDFALPNGKIANNIVFAGENGSGKTKLLEFIHTALESNYMRPGKDANLDTLTRIVLDIADKKLVSTDEGKTIDEAHLLCEDVGNHNINSIVYYSDGARVSRPKGQSSVALFSAKNLYSSVDINYQPQRSINGPTNMTLDDENSQRKSDLATEAIQLIVDIVNEDDSDLASWVRTNQGKQPPKDIMFSRMKRFNDAFAIIFGEKLKFKQLERNSIPIFSKNGKDVSIYALSSGEKQIVFRGIQILRNKKILDENPVLIDEPELSMHPKWEMDIFDYYRKICTSTDDQHPQLFLATHSEHVLRSILDRDDGLLVKITAGKNEAQYFSKYGAGEILPTSTIAEIKYSVFDLYTIDFHIALYGFIENHPQVKAKNIGEVDRWLVDHNAPKKEYCFKQSKYQALPTYIRNCIDHPDNPNGYTFSLNELCLSIEYMKALILQIGGR